MKKLLVIVLAAVVSAVLVAGAELAHEARAKPPCVKESTPWF